MQNRAHEILFPVIWDYGADGDLDGVGTQGLKNLGENSIFWASDKANNPEGVTCYSPALPALGSIGNDRSPARDDAIPLVVTQTGSVDSLDGSGPC